MLIGSFFRLPAGAGSMFLDPGRQPEPLSMRSGPLLPCFLQHFFAVGRQNVRCMGRRILLCFGVSAGLVC
jgi:hypothetical protein